MDYTIENSILMTTFYISDYYILDTRYNFSFNMPDNDFIYKLKRIEYFLDELKKKIKLIEYFLDELKKKIKLIEYFLDELKKKKI